MIDDVTIHLLVLRVRLHIPEAQSLKAKRMVIKSLKEKIRNKFNVSVAELGDQDKWQVCLLGICSIGNDLRHMHSAMQTILAFIERLGTVIICESDLEEL